MSPTFLARFLDQYIRAMFRVSKENWIAVALSILVVVQRGWTGHLNAAAWRENAVGELFPWVVILCGLASWHAINAGRTLVVAISEESKASEDSDLFLPGGEKHRIVRPVKPQISHHKIKAFLASTLLMLLLVMIPLLVWRIARRPVVMASGAPINIQRTHTLVPLPLAAPPPKASSQQAKQSAPKPKAKSWTTNIDMTYEWAKPIKKVGPPSEAEADVLRPILKERDTIRRMETRERLVYYDKQAENLELFSVAWEPKNHEYDDEACQGPMNDTPQAKMS